MTSFVECIILLHNMFNIIEPVRRMYTNKRRDHLESKKKDGYTENLLKSKRYRARRQRVNFHYIINII